MVLRGDEVTLLWEAVDEAPLPAMTFATGGDIYTTRAPIPSGDP
jgi:hypothetical protein